ncbi:putative oxidoreductase YvaA [Polystyrenella longa]|uniref:Putative oxidoreductase YvaA n=1 Tax=Polystyrenella longa TaxID=2528007 RepID=A0A518CSR5_9PLAN|nr:Gfo/Idh/MocA family oxidoreductase [Polystyrenella longa]QDU82260.1 putative oxidoreductase YvaA [Polystyrenella longa]
MTFKVNNPVRIGLIGCGRMGFHHAEQLLKSQKAQITLLHDVQRDNAERLRDQFNLSAHILTDLDPISNNSIVDACIISSPTGLHYEQTRLCLEARIAVLCEKPLAHNPQQIEELNTISAQTGIPVSIAYQRRSSSEYRTLRREVLSGKWGPVRSISGHIIEDWQSTITGTWRDDVQSNWGGFVGDAGSHKIDCLFYATELQPQEVLAWTDCCGSQVEITAQVLARFSGDVRVAIDFVGNGHYLGEIIAIHCEHADVIVQDGHVYLAKNDEKQKIINLEPESTPVDEFLAMLLEGQENIAPLNCAMPVYQMTNAILESARQSRSIILDCQNT